MHTFKKLFAYLTIFTNSLVSVTKRYHRTEETFNSSCIIKLIPLLHSFILKDKYIILVIQESCVLKLEASKCSLGDSRKKRYLIETFP